METCTTFVLHYGRAAEPETAPRSAATLHLVLSSFRHNSSSHPSSYRQSSVIFFVSHYTSRMCPCVSATLINPNKFPTIICDPHLRTFSVSLWVHEFKFAFIDHVIVSYKESEKHASSFHTPWAFQSSWWVSSTSVLRNVSVHHLDYKIPQFGRALSRSYPVKIL